MSEVAETLAQRDRDAVGVAVSSEAPPGVADDMLPRIIDMGDGRRAEMRTHACFACGDLNLHGLRLRLHVEGGSCWTEAVPEPRFGGWEGIVHGGILCAILDEVMAWSLIGQDCWGVTARMAVQFLRPVEVGRPIRAEGRLVDRRRRLLRTDARILDPATGDVLATAEATYLDAPAERKAQLKKRYGFRILDADVAP
jgi:acyl-coenzyme A thioesterase PaaI-like protein